MAIERLKIKPWGPPVLREIIGELQDAINERTPAKGLGIKLDEQPTGFQISTNEAQSPSDENINSARVTDSGQASSGTYAVIATEFVNASNIGTDSDKILYNHGIGANRLVNNGDSIRATYGLTMLSGGDQDILVRFGNGDAGDLVIVDAEGFSFSDVAAAKIDVLIMRTSATTFRYNTSILLSSSDDTEQLVICNSGGLVGDGTISGFTNDQFITLWAGAFGVGASTNLITARMALIEYVPA